MSIISYIVMVCTNGTYLLDKHRLFQESLFHMPGMMRILQIHELNIEQVNN